MLYSKKISALVKVFKDENPISCPECGVLTALKGDNVSFQIVYSSDETQTYTFEVISELKKHVEVRTVEYVKVGVLKDEWIRKQMLDDGNYISTESFEAPDYLRKPRGNRIKVTKGKYRTLWVEAEIPRNERAGDKFITVVLKNSAGETVSEQTQKITVFDAVLPESDLIRTEWFHTDCIADYYGYDVFSEKHWKAIENFMKTAVKRGITMILTPVFTPPLDTEIGGERTTVQLVDVRKDGEVWSFGYDKLERWIKLAKKCGFKQIEISHFFTQWGAKAAPKVMATVDGEYKRVFGWDTLVEDGEYPKFLSVFVPSLVNVLRSLGVADDCYFHVSDEPHIDNKDNYLRAKNAIAPYLEGFKIIDALSRYEFYSTGVVEHPIPCTSDIGPFIENGVTPLWTYYCCAQGYKLSNRFMAMTLPRTRAIGIQMFKYHIEGFLQWGYNFYNTQFSKTHINPYKVTDAGGAFPSGDAFSVYPGAGGKPEESIRLITFHTAQNDLAVLRALAEKTSYEYVLGIIEEDLDEPLTFESYPQSEFYYISLRNKINKELAKRSYRK